MVKASKSLKRNARQQAVLEAMDLELERQFDEYRWRLAALQLIATLAPLIGVLGTVIGMIETLNQLGGSCTCPHPPILAPGFCQALMSTWLALAVAIPAKLLHFLLSNYTQTTARRVKVRAWALMARFTEPGFN